MQFNLAWLKVQKYKKINNINNKFSIKKRMKNQNKSIKQNQTGNTTKGLLFFKKGSYCESFGSQNSTVNKVHLLENNLTSSLFLSFTNFTKGFKSLTLLAVFFFVSVNTFGQIAQRGTPTTANISSASSAIQISKPSNVAAGDLMIVSIVQNETDNDNGGLSNVTATGWTLIDGRIIFSEGNSNNSNAWHGTVLYRVADGTEGSSFAFALPNSRADMAVGSIVAFSGVDVLGGVNADGTSGGPFDVDPSTLNVATAAGTTATATTLTTASANSAVIMLTMVNDDNTFSNWAATSPASLTELYEEITTNGDDASVGAAWAIKPTAGATGNGTVTLSGSDMWGSILIALKPKAFYSKGSLAPQTAANWNTKRDGTGTNAVAGDFTSGNCFVIQNGHSMTTTGTWSVEGTNSIVLIENGGTLTSSSAITLSSATIFQVDNGGTYIHSNTSAPSTTIFGGTERFGASSNVRINNWRNNTTVITTGVTLPFGNLELNWTANTSNWQQTWASTFTLCAGNFTVTSLGTGSIRFNANNPGPTITIAGNYTQTGGIVDFSSGTSSTVLNVGGDFIHTGGTVTETGAGSGTIVMNGAAAQTVESTGLTNNINFTVAPTGAGTVAIASGKSFTSGAGTISVSNTSTATEFTNNGTLAISSTLAGAGSFVNSGTFNSSGAISVTGNLSNTGTMSRSGSGTITTALANFTNTGTLNISGSGTITGITNSTGGIVNHSGSSTITNFNNATSTSTLNISTTPTVPTFTTLTTSVAGNTVNYTGAGNQTVKGQVYGGNLGLSGSGTKTLGANTTVGNVLTVGSECTLNLSTFTLTLSGTGTPFVKTGTFTPSAGTVIYSGATANITAATYYNLQVSTAGNKTLLGNTTVSNALTINSGKLDLANQTLTLGGAFTGSATNSLIGSATSNLITSGTVGSLFFDQTTPGTTNVLEDLTINSGTVSLGNALNITAGSNFGVVTVGSGATLTTGGFLTLKSDAAGTACVGTSAGTISGNVNVERYVSGRGRKWRFFSSPVSGASIANWMNQFYVTGPGTGTVLGAPNSNGWHTTYSNIKNATVTTTSIRTYNETTITGDINAGWTNVTPSQTLDKGLGYRVYVRGPIGDTAQIGSDANNKSGLGTAFTLNLTGGVTNTNNAGNVTMPVTFTSSGTADNDGWNLLGNPYPCAFDWNAFYDNVSSTKTNISPTVHIFDATSNGYKSYNASSGGSLTNGIIPSGAGFFVQAIGSTPSLIFTEAFKTVLLTPAELHKGAQTDEFTIKYSKDSTENDEFLVKMMEGATFNKDDYDINKLRNENLNLSSYGADSVQLTLSAIPLVKEETRIKLNVEATLVGTYKFEFKNMDNFDAGVSVSLFDRYTNTTNNVKANTVYSFVMDAGINQWGKNRFELILNGKATTSVNENINTVAATQLSVYPNPATSVLNININNTNFKNSNVSITNVSGQELVNTNMSGTNTQLNIESLSNGIYFLNITNENGFNKTVKFVK